jgi:peptidoglycan/xylan/chitin deacetylase (PgdA/CDA1 family)
MKSSFTKAYYTLRGHWPSLERYETLVKEQKGKLRVVVFHGFDTSGSTRFNYKFSSLKRFDQLIQQLKPFSNFISLTDLEENNLSNELLNVLFVSDDGFANNLTAIPIIEKHQVPFTLFLSTNSLRGKRYLWPDLLDLSVHYGSEQLKLDNATYSRSGKKYTSSNGQDLKQVLRTGTLQQVEEIEEQLKHTTSIPEEISSIYLNLLESKDLVALAKHELISFGDHGISHTNFKYLTEEELLEEMQKSKRYLMEVTGQPIHSLAFPFGEYESREVQLAQSVGYTHLFGEEKTIGDLVIPRISVNPFSSLSNQVKAILKGHY